MKIDKNIEVITLIYKSTSYLKFITSQLKSDTLKVNGWKVGVRIVANDATEEVLKKLPELDIPYSIYNDPSPEDFYLNRVYRCWNHSGQTSAYDNICFVNSDMAFSKNWLENLLKHHDGYNIPCSRLIESGKMPSGKFGMGVNLGRNPETFDEKLWEEISMKLRLKETRAGGLYMPCILNKELFVKSGMYPEGNIYTDGAGTLNGPVLKSGDDYYFKNVLENKFNMRHVTVFDSLVYHIQEGEKDSQ